jgi:glycosyltransferase involved in cell wall biosynthesis
MILPLGLIRSLRLCRPDVVHLHSGAWYKGALAARLAGVPWVVFTEHGRIHDDPWAARQLDRLAARLTDVIVPVSRQLETYLRDTLGVPAGRLRVIENGVDVELCSPGRATAEMRARLRLPTDALVVGSVGRLEHVKGYDRLLKTFAVLKGRSEATSNWHLVLCGDGTERASLELLAEQLGIRKAVTFAGWVDANADVYRCFDVFAVTSRSEGLSLSLLEAMACGIAPVVNDVGANREVLGPALERYAVADGAWDSFAELVAELLRDRAVRARAGAQAATRVRERFSLARVVREYCEVYMDSGDYSDSRRRAFRWTQSRRA